jgi:uncharacterized membrane protein YidH (DUF202 family)
MSREGSDTVGSQAERTSLAWSRTLLALAVVTAFIAVHAAAVDLAPAAAFAGVSIAVILAASASTISRRAWRRARAALDGRGAAAHPLALALVSAAGLLLAAIALATIPWARWT